MSSELRYLSILTTLDDERAFSITTYTYIFEAQG